MTMPRKGSKMPNRKSCGPLSAEHKANMGAAIRARYAADPSYSEKLSAVHKGKPKSAEMRRRLSETKRKIHDAKRTRCADEAQAKQSGPVVAAAKINQSNQQPVVNARPKRRKIMFGGHSMTAEQYAEMVKILEVAGNAK